MKAQWIPIEKIQFLIQFESFAFFVLLLFIAFIFYKILLKKITEKRHANMRQRFFRTAIYLAISTSLAFSHWILFENARQYSADYPLLKMASYLGLFALTFGVICVIRLAQIYVYLYLFFMNMSVGVPRLIANMFSLVFTIVIVSWLAADVFGFHLVAVLATSAVFSLVLGLALQDTLGNLFSGVALQIDRPFSIGDWVEIRIGSEKWVGQVHEISWRATTLIGFADEFILIPNRVIAQSQLINYSFLHKSVRLNQMFRFPFDVPVATARMALLEGLQNIPEILSEPPPQTLITEVTDSWISIKVFYSLKDYGDRYGVGDQVISKILEKIKFHNLKMATPSMNVVKNDEIR